MADIPLFNNLQYFFLIDDDDAAGAVVAAPPGDVNSVASGNAASLPMAVTTMPSGPSTGAPAVSVIPAVQRSDPSNGGGGITCTLSDTAGLPMPVVVTFRIEPNPAPVALALDTATVVTLPQAVPAAAGP